MRPTSRECFGVVADSCRLSVIDIRSQRRTGPDQAAAGKSNYERFCRRHSPILTRTEIAVFNETGHCITRHRVVSDGENSFSHYTVNKPVLTTRSETAVTVFHHQ